MRPLTSLLLFSASPDMAYRLSLSAPSSNWSEKLGSLREWERAEREFFLVSAAIAVATNSASPAVLDAETLAATASLSGHTATVMCLDAAASSSGAATGPAPVAVLVSRFPLSPVPLLPALHQASQAGVRAGSRGRPLKPFTVNGATSSPQPWPHLQTPSQVTGSKDRSIRLWSGTTGRCYGVGEGHVAAVTAVAFGHRSSGIVASGSADKLLKIWDVSAAVAEAALGSEPAAPLSLRVTAAVAAHEKDVNAIAISPNDALVATGGGDRIVKLWKLPNLLPHGTLRGHRRGIWDVKFSPVDQVRRGTRESRDGRGGEPPGWQVGTCSRFWGSGLTGP